MRKQETHRRPNFDGRFGIVLLEGQDTQPHTALFYPKRPEPRVHPKPPIWPVPVEPEVTVLDELNSFEFRCLKHYPMREGRCYVEDCPNFKSRLHDWLFSLEADHHASGNRNGRILLHRPVRGVFARECTDRHQAALRGLQTDFQQKSREVPIVYCLVNPNTKKNEHNSVTWVVAEYNSRFYPLEQALSDGKGFIKQFRNILVQDPSYKDYS